MDSFLNSRWGTLLFLSLFHVIGGIALGLTLNRLVRARRIDKQALFFVVWGGMFGCMPLAMSEGDPRLLAAQVGILALAIGVPFAMGHSLREAFAQPAVQKIGFGGVFFVAGMGVLGVAIRSIGEAPLPIFLMAGVFVAVGLSIFVGGLREVSRMGDEA